MSDLSMRPQDKKYILAKIANSNLVPFFSTGTILPGTKCANCGDLHSILVHYCRPVAPDYETFKSPVHWVGSQKYIIEEDDSFPCPDCSSDHNGRVRGIFERCGVPSHEWDWTVHHIKGMSGKTIAYNAACSILADVPYPQGFILLHGDYGVGKSGILKSLTVMLASAEVPAVYINAAEMLSQIRATFSSHSEETEASLHDQYGNVRFLAIDEVDTVSDTEWALSTLRLLIDRRYEGRSIRCTMIATNRDPDQLWPYLASRCEDGLRIKVGGESLRGVKSDKMEYLHK